MRAQTVILLLLAAATWAGLGAHAGASDPPLGIERIATSPPFPWTESDAASLRLERAHLQPGATIDMRFPGPVLLYVERGVLTLTLSSTADIAVTGSDGAAIAGEPSVDGVVMVVPAGASIFSESGTIGRIDNTGTATVDLEVVSLVLERGGEATSEDAEESAAAAPPVGSPSSSPAGAP